MTKLIVAYRNFAKSAQKYVNIHTDTAIICTCPRPEDSRGITPLILNLGTILQVSGQFYAPAGFIPRKETCYPLNRKLCGFQ